nr:probable sphingolipid transporter spinster homolog 2 [Tanacetum cinerariifolium]
FSPARSKSSLKTPETNVIEVEVITADKDVPVSALFRFWEDIKALLIEKIYVVNVLGYIAYNFVIGAYSYWGPKAGYSIYHMNNADMLFGGFTIMGGIMGTLAGGFIIDRMNSTISNAFKDNINNWRTPALILTSILFLASGIWFIGIFLHGVDRYNEDSEHPDTTVERSNTTPLLDDKTAKTPEIKAMMAKALAVGLHMIHPITFIHPTTQNSYTSTRIEIVDGAIKKPEKGSKDYMPWIKVDAIIKGWLTTAMEKNIRNSVKYAGTTSEIWSDLNERINEHQEKEHLYEFLMGLDTEFTVIRTQILATKPTPLLGTAYHMVAEDERQRTVSSENVKPLDSAAFKAFQRKIAPYASNKERTGT